MEGYLNLPEKTEEVFLRKWYKTGDVGKLDRDGFLYITDRLSRFSKIGGEMVPHVKVESKLTELSRENGDEDVEFVVTGVSDSERGEKLVVLHTDTEIETNGLLEELRKTDVPSLWLPKSREFYEIEQVPKLGTGKLDLQEVKRIARQKAT
ncbi:MAG: hypothetical protein ABEK50_13290, partial [bacterium]